ncbi:MAG TPA: hypothetical protein VEN81_16505 [Planctomycetota bacterium]|nr:hypothetical protein [Planctomycetota bacterium]
MAERELLEYMKGYGFDHPTLAAAFDADPEKAFGHLSDASYTHSGWFTPGILDAVLARLGASPAKAFGILHHVASQDPTRAAALIELFERHFPQYPEAAQDAVFYVAANDPELLRASLVDRIAEHAPSHPYQAFHTLQFVLAKRPELITERIVKSVVLHLALAPNQAFTFIREAIKTRPEFTALSTVALFDCVAHAQQGWLKREMMQDIFAVAAHSHVKTGLEQALRGSAGAGSRRARTLMALLFRQRTRALQRVLLEALDLAAGWEPVWDFMLFLVDQSDPKRISTAAAAEFLESAYRLHFLVSPREFRELLVDRLDLRDPPEASFAGAPFLDQDPELSLLHRKVSLLARRFGAPLRLTPLEEFRERTRRLRRERDALSAAQTTRRLRRKRNLEARIERPDDLASRRELAKKVADALRAQAVEVTRHAFREAMEKAYAAAARQMLGRELDLSRVDPAILPAFLYYERLDRMPNNRRYLARLIEDRVEGRPSDWMRTEPPAAEWADRVRSAHPGARLERWRAAFARTFSYDPEHASSEKGRRIEHDLAQTRELFRKLEVEKMEKADLGAMREALRGLEGSGKDPAVLEEIRNNLERIRIAQQAPDSDFEGKIALEVETDPIKVLFMGEYGFASCLSLRGANMWSAVSNAIDLDKAVVWARDPAGNIVGRRLIALTPEGVVSYRTYTNRNGLALDGFFEEFIAQVAAECGVPVTHHVSPGPLLSDRWYDDGSL